MKNVRSDDLENYVKELAIWIVGMGVRKYWASVTVAFWEDVEISVTSHATFLKNVIIPLPNLKN